LEMACPDRNVLIFETARYGRNDMRVSKMECELELSRDGKRQVQLANYCSIDGGQSFRMSNIDATDA